MYFALMLLLITLSGLNIPCVMAALLLEVCMILKKITLDNGQAEFPQSMMHIKNIKIKWYDKWCHDRETFCITGILHGKFTVRIRRASPAESFRWLHSSWEPIYQHGLTIIPAWLSKYGHYKVWNKITYLFLNLSSAAVEVWELIKLISPYTLLGMWLLIHGKVVWLSGLWEKVQISNFKLIIVIDDKVFSCEISEKQIFISFVT